MPTIVFAAKDASGRDVTDVHVMMDGKAIADRLDGTTIDVDPGVHSIEFRRNGYSTMSESIVARTGEKNRQIIVTLTPIEVPRERPNNVVVIPRRLEPSVTAVTSERRPLVTAAVVLGVVGAIGLVTGAATGIAAIATKDAQCTMNVCASGTLSTLWSETSVATAALIGGGVLLTVGVVLFFVGHKTDHKTAWRGRELVYRF